jgi:exodeoxyribonuclease VII large subunit
MMMENKMTLTELQVIIKESLYLSLPDMYWVTAEISEINENSAGHCYLELIEKHPDDINIRARVRAIIWSNRYRFLKPLFRDATGESLKEGLKIFIRVKIEYHEVYGLSLVISDIDPAFTIGEMAIKRNLIIRRLQEEGVFEMNKELEFPGLPRNIAVISSGNAAGYTDFINQLKGNSYGYVFNTLLFEASVQGAETEKSVINALARIADNVELFDVVVIIRGGGSQTDLSWFDNYNIAYYVTQFPIPVLTGIGHEKDLSVTDMVAWQSLKTPTATADFLISCMLNAEKMLNELGSEIAEVSGIIIEKNRIRLETGKIRLIPVARALISDMKERLADSKIDIINIGKGYIIREEIIPSMQISKLVSATRTLINGSTSDVILSGSKLKNLTFNCLRQNQERTESLEKTLGILSPVNVLKRGFTITSMNGKIIKRSTIAKPGDIIDTQFTDGTINSKVLEKK